MAIFRRDTKEEELEQQNLLLDDDIPINFSPLWEDEEPSGLTQYIIPILTLVLLFVILIKVW